MAATPKSGPEPTPTVSLDRNLPAELRAAEASFAALPDGALAVVDGLAYGALPEVAARAAGRSS